MENQGDEEDDDLFTLCICTVDGVPHSLNLQQFASGDNALIGIVGWNRHCRSCLLIGQPNVNSKM